MVLGQPYNEKVDVFSFGVILFEVLFRKLMLVDEIKNDPRKDAQVSEVEGEVRGEGGAGRHHVRVMGGWAAHHPGGCSWPRGREAPPRVPHEVCACPPVPPLPWLQAYAERVARGFRPEIPKHWPELLHELIAACWAQDPHQRPNFAAVVDALHELNRENCVGKLDLRLWGAANSNVFI